mmetsp:Transcript_23352/g.51075  ORF Transcript_23352/g.51075 Transcript_23352/m.51075 type:complete len:244 (-) Transcript_23352:80-811(-)
MRLEGGGARGAVLVEGERHQLHVLVRLAVAARISAVVEGESTPPRECAQHLPHGGEVGGVDGVGLLLEVAGDDQQMVLHHIEFVQQQHVVRRQVAHIQVLLVRQEGVAPLLWLRLPPRLVLRGALRLVLQSCRHAHHKLYASGLIFDELRLGVNTVSSPDFLGPCECTEHILPQGHLRILFRGCSRYRWSPSSCVHRQRWNTALIAGVHPLHLSIRNSGAVGSGRAWRVGCARCDSCSPNHRG